MDFRILSYNIRKGKGGYRGPVTVGSMAEKLATRQADIILCQEVFHSSNGHGPYQSSDLGNRLSYKSVYEPNAVYRKGHHGNATLTHFDIHRYFNSNLSTNPIEKRGVLYSLIECRQGPVHVLNTHLGLNKVQRLKQVLSIANILSEICHDGHPVLLAGDFNDWTGQLDQAIRKYCGLTNALATLDKQQRRSWPSARPVFGLDRIYFRGLRLVGVRVLSSNPWDRLSDHLPVEAEFAHT